MEKNIAKWSYWLGALCVFLALAFRLGAAFTTQAAFYTPQGPAIGYASFLRGAVIFLLLSIAASSYVSMNSKS